MRIFFIDGPEQYTFKEVIYGPTLTLPLQRKNGTISYLEYSYWSFVSSSEEDVALWRLTPDSESINIWEEFLKDDKERFLWNQTILHRVMKLASIVK